MKRFLRAILDWLDRKFPDQVILTPEAFQKLKNDLAAAESNLAAVMQSSADAHKLINRFRDDMLAALKSSDKNKTGDFVSKFTVDEIQADIKKIKDEFSKFSLSMGFTNGRAPFER